MLSFLKQWSCTLLNTLTEREGERERRVWSFGANRGYVYTPVCIYNRSNLPKHIITKKKRGYTHIFILHTQIIVYTVCIYYSIWSLVRRRLVGLRPGILSRPCQIGSTSNDNSPNRLARVPLQRNKLARARFSMHSINLGQYLGLDRPSYPEISWVVTQRVRNNLRPWQWVAFEFSRESTMDLS